MSRKVRLLSAITAGVLLLASCGGGDSSGRTKNSALCYATQEEKDAAVQAARDAFDAAMTGVPTEDAPEETPTSVEEETPTTISEDTTTTIGLEEAGGGYRRPAVRIGSGGDTSTTVEEQSGEGEGEALTPEQQQAQMELEAAEAQPVCETDSESAEISCTATRTVDGVSDDCADGDVRVEDSNGGEWSLVATAEDGTETVLAQGTYDVTTVGQDTPVIIPITYSLSGSSDSESSSDGCSAVFTSTGVSWDCSNGELFNAAIEDMSNPGVYPLVECSASGSFTVADGQPFWFNFSLGATFFDGWNTDREQNVQIAFTVPEDTEGVCTEVEAEEIDWESLPFNGKSEIQTLRYSFTVPEDLGGPVLARFESTDYFDVDIDDVQDFESYPCDSECPPYVGYSVWELAPGEYFIEIEENSETVSWVSNVELIPSPLSIGDLPFSYTSNGEKTMYSLVVEESQTVTLFATAGQTCLPSEDDEEGNGFVDSELDIVGPNGVDESDDNSGRSAGNCSASLIELELQPGTYAVYVEDDDREGGSITLSSSNELQLGEFEWSSSSQDVVNETAVEFVVPEGGTWFKAKAFTNQLETYTQTSKYDGETVDSGGCANPDGDFSTSDGNCVMTSLELIFEDGLSIGRFGNAEYTELTQVGELWLVTWINSYGSELEIFLPEGTYQLVARGEGREDMDRNFKLEYGFGSLLEVEAKPIDVPPASPNSETAKLPTGSLVQDSRVSTSVSAAVEEFVCDSVCIDALFVNAGLSDGSISVNAGAEIVTIQRGQKRAVVPVGKGADSISAQGVSADGTTVVDLSSKIVQLPESVQSSINSKTATGISENGSNLVVLIVLGLVVLILAGAATTLIRRRQSI